MTDSSLSISFRSQEVARIFQIMKAGDSCQLIGVGSVGKSNLMRFLLRPDVRKTYLGEDTNNFVLVNIDANKLSARSDWGLAELMIHQLRIELVAYNLPESAQKALQDYYLQSSDPKIPFLALRSLDGALAVAFQCLPSVTIIFVMDEFDQLGRDLAPQTFNNLRAFRDEHKYHLAYLIASRKHLDQLRVNGNEIENFSELFTTNTLWISSYSEADAREMVERLSLRFKQLLTDDEIIELVKRSGGHPGLLRTAFMARRDGVADWSMYPGVIDECQQIWSSLTDSEQRALTNLIQPILIEPDGSVKALLEGKGLLGGPWVKAGMIFSPLFEDYIRKQQPTSGSKIFIDEHRRYVWVDGRRIDGLAPLEFRCMAILLQNRGKVLTRDELAEHLYGDDKQDGVSDESIDSVVKRLRRDIEPNAGKPRYILTVRGHGYRLQDGEAQEEG